MKSHGSFWLYFDSDSGGSTSHWEMDSNGAPDSREPAYATVLKAN